MLLTATDLVAGYLPGVDILNGASLELRQGELVGIIGPNGAGKSTLIKALFGLVPVRSGAVVLDGEDITGLPAHELVAQGVGYVPQTKNVFPSLTIEENLRMGIFLDPGRFDERFERGRVAVPAARRPPQGAGGPALRRPAPDGGDGPGAHDRPVGAAARRAVRRALAASTRTRSSPASTR